jgi:hypothetical protein
MTCKLRGLQNWPGSRDAEGHRTWKATFLVVSDQAGDGPATVIKTPGLPVLGAPWVIGNDVDTWAWCHADTTLTPVITKEPNFWWEVEMMFSTKPPDKDKRRCQDNEITDPLMEPQKISGQSVKYQVEATHDRFGLRITNSAFEQLRGPQVEFDQNRMSVKIEQNRANLEYPLIASMLNTVNANPLWGFEARMIKLSDFSFERALVGQCNVYFKRTFTFDIVSKLTGQFVSGWDRVLLDEGTKVLKGHWNPSGNWVLDPVNGAPPDPDNPTHFIRFKDKNNENARVILDGMGQPVGVFIGSGSRAGDDPGTPGNRLVQYYNESDFTLLGIPLDFSLPTP